MFVSWDWFVTSCDSIASSFDDDMSLPCQMVNQNHLDCKTPKNILYRQLVMFLFCKNKKGIQSVWIFLLLVPLILFSLVDDYQHDYDNQWMAVICKYNVVSGLFVFSRSFLNWKSIIKKLASCIFSVYVRTKVWCADFTTIIRTKTTLAIWLIVKLQLKLWKLNIRIFYCKQMCINVSYYIYYTVIT